MNLSSGQNTAGKNRKRKRPVQKPKIRWDVLGLQGVSTGSQPLSIEDIRRQVTNLASTGIGQDTRMRSLGGKSSGPAAKRPRRPLQ